MDITVGEHRFAGNLSAIVDVVPLPDSQSRAGLNQHVQVNHDAVFPQKRMLIFRAVRRCACYLTRELMDNALLH